MYPLHCAPLTSASIQICTPCFKRALKQLKGARKITGGHSAICKTEASRIMMIKKEDMENVEVLRPTMVIHWQGVVCSWPGWEVSDSSCSTVFTSGPGEALWWQDCEQQKGLNGGSVETPSLNVLKKEVVKLLRTTVRNRGDEADKAHSPLTFIFTQFLCSDKMTERNLKLGQVRVQSPVRAEASAWEGVQEHTSRLSKTPHPPVT